jgi:hypothetical protein
MRLLATVLATGLVVAACSSVPLGTARGALSISEQDSEEFLNRAGPGKGEFSLPGGKRVACGGKGCLLRWRTQPGLFDGDRAVGGTATVKGQVALSVDDLTKLRRLVLKSKKVPVVVEDRGWKLTCVRGMCELDVPYPLRPTDPPPSERRTGEAFRGLVLMSDAAASY